MRAKDLMTSPVITVRPNTPVKEVARTLVDREINAVPVVDPEEGLIGIVSEADLVSLETEPDPRAHMIPIVHQEPHVPKTARDVMTGDVIAVQEQADVAEVAHLMLHHRIKQIPVVLGNDVVGIIARRDVLRLLARSDLEIKVELEELLDDEILMLGRFQTIVEGGVVTLTGPRDEGSRRLAELLAQSVPGVVGVRFANGEKLQETRN